MNDLQELKNTIKEVLSDERFQRYLSNNQSIPAKQQYAPTETVLNDLSRGETKDYKLLQFISPYSMHCNLRLSERMLYAFRQIHATPLSKKQKQGMNKTTKEMVSQTILSGWMSDFDQHRTQLLDERQNMYFRNDYEEKKIKILLKDKEPIIFEEEEYRQIKKSSISLIKKMIRTDLELKDEELYEQYCLDFWKECLTIHPFLGIPLYQLGMHYLNRLDEEFSEEEIILYKNFKIDPMVALIPLNLTRLPVHIGILSEMASKIEKVRALVHKSTFIQISKVMVEYAKELTKTKKQFNPNMLPIASCIPKILKMI